MEGGGVQSHLRAIFDLQSLQDKNSLQDQNMSHENRTSRGMVCEGEGGWCRRYLCLKGSRMLYVIKGSRV